MHRCRGFEVSMVLALEIVLGACGSDNHGGSSDDGATPTTIFTPRFTVETTQSTEADPGCSPKHPFGLQLHAQSSQELPYLDLIIACTDPSQGSTLLTNNTDLVWRIQSTTRASVTQLSDHSLKFDAFAAFANSVYSDALMYPGSTVLIDASPADVSWFIYGGLSASFVIFNRISETVEGIGGDVAIDVLSGDSLGHKALFTCLKTAVDVAGTNLEKLTGPARFDTLLEGLGVASSATACGSALLKARDDELTRFGTIAGEWTEDITRWSKDLSFLEHSNSLLEDAARLIEIGIHA